MKKNKNDMNLNMNLTDKPEYANYEEKIFRDPLNEKVNHPMHYTSHPSGVECIDITEHMNFNLGNAVKYIWRFSCPGLIDEKEPDILDLNKAHWYILREIQRLTK